MPSLVIGNRQWHSGKCIERKCSACGQRGLWQARCKDNGKERTQQMRLLVGRCHRSSIRWARATDSVPHRGIPAGGRGTVQYGLLLSVYAVPLSLYNDMVVWGTTCKLLSPDPALG